MLTYFISHESLLYSSIILAITMFLSLGIFFTCKYSYPKLTQTDKVWDDILVKAIQTPSQIVIWVYGCTYAIETFNPKNNFFSISTIGMHLRECVLAFAVIWFLLRYINSFEQRIISSSYPITQKIDKAKLLSASRLVRIVIIALSIIVLLQASGIPISGLLAFGGMGALIVGLAAKDLLANFFGSLLIYADRPFTVGDWINSPDKDIEGIVEKIGWRLTTIRRFDKRILIIPNSIFSTIALENVSKMTHRRLFYLVGIRYCDLPLAEAVCTLITKMLADTDAIDHESPYYTKVLEFAPSSINIRILAFTQIISNIDFMALQHELLLKIASCIKEAGADFAFPTQTLEIPQLTQTLKAPLNHNKNGADSTNTR